MNYLENLEILGSICHNIRKQDANSFANTVHESQALLDFEPAHLAVLKQRLTDTLGEGSDAIEMIYSAGERSVTIETISSMLLNQSDEEFVTSSKELTRLLADTQTHKKIPGGPVFVIRGTTATDDRPFLIILKSEYSDGFITEINAGTLSVKMLNQLFLTKGQKVHKVAFISFIDPTLTGHDLVSTQNLYFKIFDSNSSIVNKGYASYFYSRFLGLNFRPDGNVLTSKFFGISKKYFLRFIEDKEQRISAMTNMFNYLLNASTVQINTTTFSNQCFTDPQDRIKYRRHLNDNGLTETTFQKYLEFILDKLANRTLVFENNIKIKIPAIWMEVSEIEFNRESDTTTIKILGLPTEQ